MLPKGFIRHTSFKQQFKKAPKKVQDAFESRIRLFLEQPTHPVLRNHPLQGEWAGHWSISITGDIRAVYRLEGNIMIFLAIGTHSQLYGE